MVLNRILEGDGLSAGKIPWFHNAAKILEPKPGMIFDAKSQRHVGSVAPFPNARLEVMFTDERGSGRQAVVQRLVRLEGTEQLARRLVVVSRRRGRIITTNTEHYDALSPTERAAIDRVEHAAVNAFRTATSRATRKKPAVSSLP